MTATPFAVIVPMANEEKEFAPFIAALTGVLDELGDGAVYLVVDLVSRDRTLDLCRELAELDPRYHVVWAPENRCIVDAYLRGYREAHAACHRYLIEMDAGLSHDPRALPGFITLLQEGYDCVYGSRFMANGSMGESTLWRRFLSRSGTLLANLLLGTGLTDMTSGYQGFQADVIGALLRQPLRSTAHFYQTEVRYLLRNFRSIELPIHYRAPSPRVSGKAIANSLIVLAYYSLMRLAGKPAAISRQ